MTPWVWVDEPTSPALVPEPQTPLGAREYKVVGEHAVFEHAPGETFTAALEVEQAELLIQSGALAYVPPPKAAKATKKE